jgi:hypothetical protein
MSSKRQGRRRGIVGGIDGPNETEARQRQALERVALRPGQAGLEAARLRRAQQRRQVVGRRELLEDELGVERHSMQAAKTVQRPHERLGQHRIAGDRLGGRHLHASPPRMPPYRQSPRVDIPHRF